MQYMRRAIVLKDIILSEWIFLPYVEILIVIYLDAIQGVFEKCGEWTDC